MRRNLKLVVASLSVIGLSASLPGLGQMHKVAKPEDVVRAVGVYEWIGDRNKPTATRLIPVTLYIDGSFQDAGLYLSRPIPFALDIGTVYEVNEAGVPGGSVELISARRLKPVGESESFDIGWVGYGKFAPPVVKKTVVLKQMKPTATITSDKPDKDPDRPSFSRRSDHTEAAPDTKSSPASAGSTSATPPDDPDRPHLSKKPDTADPAAAAADGKPDPADPSDPSLDKTTQASSKSPADPDRPTLRKRSPEEAKKARKEAEQSSAVGLATSLNDDPNRPTLRRGRGQQELVEADIPMIKGVPKDLHQAVAVSDASSRPVHDFSRPWSDDGERASVLGKMQVLARAQLAAYGVIAAKSAPIQVRASASSRPNSKLRHAITPESAHTQEPLLDEQLSGYTLSYGGTATYVYMAHTDREGIALRYVTVVAQRNTFGELQPAIQSVTDAAHLDRTPWMRLVDVVDAEASNRASLLFELRGQTSRQFALYRVIATRSEQTFLTGTTQ